MTQTHPLHDLNAHSDPPRNMKATIFYKNKHTNFIISDPGITPEECKKTSNTFTLPSCHNTSVAKKITMLLTIYPMIFIYNKHY